MVRALFSVGKNPSGTWHAALSRREDRRLESQVCIADSIRLQTHLCMRAIQLPPDTRKTHEPCSEYHRLHAHMSPIFYHRLQKAHWHTRVSYHCPRTFWPQQASHPVDAASFGIGHPNENRSPHNWKFIFSITQCQPPTYHQQPLYSGKYTKEFPNKITKYEVQRHTPNCITYFTRG